MRTAAPKLSVMMAVSLMISSVAQAEISWESDLRTAHEKAVAENKLLLIHFIAIIAFGAIDSKPALLSKPMSTRQSAMTLSP